MMFFLISAILAAIIGMFVRAHVMTVILRIVMGWVRLYTSIAPKEAREGRREEASSDIHEMLKTNQKAGHAQGESAILLLEWCVRGMMDDIAWSAPFAPGLIGKLAEKAVNCSDSVRRFKTPKFVIPTIGTFGLMNWGFFNSGNPWYYWLLLNGVGVVVTVLIWNQQRKWARRFFQAWMGTGILVMIAMMIWETTKFHLYNLPIFQGLVLAMSSVTPTILVADKSWRADFKKHWLPATIGWVLMIYMALIGSVICTGSITPLFTIWKTMAILMISFLTVIGFVTLAASAIWYGGLKGSSAGLRLMASGIKHLK